MPKRKTKHRKLVASKKSILISCLGVALILLIVAQLCFNLFVWDALQKQSSFQIKTLMVDGMRGLEEIRSSPQDDNKIPEVRLILPHTNEDVKNILYTHNGQPDISGDEVQISTKELSRLARMSLNGTNVDEDFEKAPEAQACSRGFTIAFKNSKVSEHPGDNLTLVSKKTLADSREVQIWREKDCGSPDETSGSSNELYKMMDNLEKYLLQIESY